MRYVIVFVSLLVAGCATTKPSAAGGGIPSEIGRPVAGQAYIYRDGPAAPPEDRSRFESTPAESRIRDLEHPGGK